MPYESKLEFNVYFLCISICLIQWILEYNWVVCEFYLDDKSLYSFKTKVNFYEFYVQ